MSANNNLEPARNKKRKYENISENNSEDFQFLIDVFGAENILKELCLFLGREDCDVYDEPNGKTRNPKLPNNFSGLAFDGAHWKGYENGKMAYNSYKLGGYDIQRDQTNNFCQSYACYLYATRGSLTNKLHNVELKKGEYIDNVIIMSNLLFSYLTNSINGKYGLEYQRWIELAIGGGKKNVNRLLRILGKMRTDIKYATDFALSQQ